jgi:hypothetical protein
MKSIRALLLLFLAFALLTTGASSALGQTGSTGALTGTVTDPSGAVISGATVTLTSISTGQVRSVVTDSAGYYQFGLLAPGNYKVSFSASGFKTVDVPSITINATNTAVLNHSLEVGTQTQQVTVESTVEAIQTQSVANGQTVGTQEMTDLPLVSRNYTQIINLSPGVVSNVSTASSLGNGTTDVAANGSRQNQNNYSMDGSSLTNYVSGTAAQTGSFPGIGIPNPDTIQEFKVQTSQYDASTGRNPGANVTVITKTGTNQFHGDVWEFNRNNFFNANDFFYRLSEASLGLPNSPQTLKQNTFGGTLGGPIVKDKLFFFASYQGIRQINGIGTSGFAAGYQSNTTLLPWNDTADFASGVCSDVRCTNNPTAYRAYLGSIFGGQIGTDTAGPVANNGSNITNTAIALLQAKGSVQGGFNQGYYFPSAPATCNGLAVTFAGCTVAISLPIVANENQYMGNTDWVINSKNTLSEKLFMSSDPQYQTFNCFILPGNCNPGAPVNAYYSNWVTQLKLTTLVTPNVVNQFHIDYHRDIEDNIDPTKVQSCDISATANIIPIANNGLACPLTTGPPFGAIAARFPEMNIVPMLDIIGGTSLWSQGGNFSMISTNYVNTYQLTDQVSWNKGKNSIRAGFDLEKIRYNNTIPSSGRGELLVGSTADFLTSSAGPPGTNPLDPTYNDGTPKTTGGIDLGFGLYGSLTHYNRVTAVDWYIQDDIKVSRKLTVNLGLRWEYNGFPDDTSGEFANVWSTQAAKVNTGSFFLNNPCGTLVGFVVPSNFAVSTFGLTSPPPCATTGVLVNSNKTLVPGSPWHNFAPRLGVAWQPLGSNFVVRAGYGWFYDRIYGNLLIDNQLNLPPYSGAAFGGFPADLNATIHNPWIAGAIEPTPLIWTPRTLTSGLGYTSDSPELANYAPLVYEYTLDLQYEFAKGWVGDIGYVGTHSIHLYNWSQDVNVALLPVNAPNNPTGNSGRQNTEMIAQSLPFNDPANPFPVTTSTVTCFPCGIFASNSTDRVSYLGFAPTGFATTITNGSALYNSLQAQLRHQFSHGLLLQVSYTWSKGITNVNTAVAGNGIQPPGAVLYGQTNSNDPLDLGQQYGLAAFNRPQRAVISYVYNIPSKWQEGATGHLLSGWAISGVTTIQDGLPFTVTDSMGATIYGGVGTSRAALADPVDCRSNGNCNSGVRLTSTGSTTQRALTNWLNPSAFESMCTVSGFSGLLPTTCTTPLPADSPYCIGGVPNPGGSPTAPCGAANATFPGAGTGYGNSVVGAVYGPGQFNWDFAILKNTKLWEGGTLQFRAEAFNIWNHAQFNPPYENDISTPATFGKITSTSTTPRIWQFGLKLLF